MSERAYIDLEARLVAQRRVLQWLVLNSGLEASKLRDLARVLDEPYPPLDHQEDPGAVPTEQFGDMAAYAAEVRLILEPLQTPDAAEGEPGKP